MFLMGATSYPKSHGAGSQGPQQSARASCQDITTCASVASEMTIMEKTDPSLKSAPSEATLKDRKTKFNNLL